MFVHGAETGSMQIDRAAARCLQPLCGAVSPAEAAAEFADGIEIAFEVGKRKIARRIVEAFSARFTGCANREHARFDGFASVQAIVAADFEQAPIALAVIQIPFKRGGHWYDASRAQHVCCFREPTRKPRWRHTGGTEQRVA